jgi:hypothetical protein
MLAHSIIRGAYSPRPESMRLQRIRMRADCKNPAQEEDECSSCFFEKCLNRRKVVLKDTTNTRAGTTIPKRMLLIAITCFFVFVVLFI